VSTSQPRLRLVALGFSLAFLAMLPPAVHDLDAQSMLAVTKSLATDATFAVPCDTLGTVSGRDGACYSTYYPLLSLLGAPLFFLGQTLTGTFYLSSLAAFIVPALSAAAAATLTVALSLRLGAGRRGAVLAGAAFAFSTEVLVFARSFFAETLAAALLALAACGLSGTRRQRSLGLVGLVLVVLAKPQVILAGPALGAAFALRERRWRPLVETIGATAAGLLIYMVFNFLRFGDISNFGGESRSLGLSDYAPIKVFDGLAILLVSPGSGLLWYSPVAVLGIIVLGRLRRQPLALGGLAVLVALLVVYVANPGNDTGWGSRYLIPALPLACAALGTLTGRIARLAVVLGVLGLLLTLPTLPAFYQRYYAEQQAQGVKFEPNWARGAGGRVAGTSWTQTQWWAVPNVQMGVWPSAARQIEDASRTDITTHLTREAGAKRRGGDPVKGQPLYQVIALWWWYLPLAAGVPSWAGALLSGIALAGGLYLVLAEARRPRAAVSGS